MKLASGHEVTPLEGEELARQERDWTGYTEGMVRLHPGSWVFPAPFTDYANKIYNFEVKPSDVMVVTWPKCGTTWVQEVVWTMRNNPNLDHPQAALPVNARVPFLEFDMLMRSKKLTPPGPDHPIMQGFNKLCPGKNPADGIFVQIGEATPEPRTLKSHLPLSLLPPALVNVGKVVYVARNPKDVLVSFCHHSRIFKNHNYVGSFEDFVKYFIDGDLVYGPYWQHLKEAWEKKDNPNLHFLFYEDLKENNMEELKRLDDFLGTKLTQEQLDNVARHTSFSQMKARDSVLGGGDMEAVFNMEIVNKDGGFFRKGEVGDWKGKYTPELEAKVDDWIKLRLSDMGIGFKYSV
ncbi:sulfotransferase 1C4-like [Penaeus indicus]|uniref:sulfotransferase 1C4-like n=1 Tax=Penaeus indicus TaxID=29960 RepID=UPI00300D3059